MAGKNDPETYKKLLLHFPVSVGSIHVRERCICWFRSFVRADTPPFFNGEETVGTGIVAGGSGSFCQWCLHAKDGTPGPISWH